MQETSDGNEAQTEASRAAFELKKASQQQPACIELNGQVVRQETSYDASQWSTISNQSEKTLARQRCFRVGPRYFRLGKRVFYRGQHLIEHIAELTLDTGPDAAMRHAADKAARHDGAGDKRGSKTRRTEALPAA